MKLVCQCCSKTVDLDPNEAFDLGWDCPPAFTQVVTCPMCPSSLLLIGGEDLERHRKKHPKSPQFEGRHRTCIDAQPEVMKGWETQVEKDCDKFLCLPEDMCLLNHPNTPVGENGKPLHYVQYRCPVCQQP